MNKFIIVQREEQKVEVFYNDEIVFYWDKDSDGHSIAQDLYDLISSKNINMDVNWVDAEEFYSEE